MASKNSITIILIFSFLHVGHAVSADVETLNPVQKILDDKKRWSDDSDWNYDDFLGLTRQKLTKVVDPGLKKLEKCCQATMKQNKVKPSLAIAPVPVDIYMYPENPNLTKAPLRRDLCKILAFMKKNDHQAFVFRSDYQVVVNAKDPKERYALFAYAQKLIAHQVSVVEVEFSDNSILELVYDQMNNQWIANINPNFF